MNTGYAGYSRSVRSLMAIENYIVPLSQINKSLIEELGNELNYDLSKIKVAQFKKYVEINASREWHHTSTYFNKTDHYDLGSIFEDKDINIVINEINSIVIEKKELANEYHIVEITETLWEGRYKNYKTKKEYIRICYLKKDDRFAYDLNENKKYDITANKNKISKYLSKKELTQDIKELIKNNNLKLVNFIEKEVK